MSFIGTLRATSPRSALFHLAMLLACCAAPGVGYASEVDIASAKSLKLAPEYRAKGIEIGTFKAFPELRQGFGHNDNPIELNVDRQGDTFSETTASLKLESIWNRHSFDVEVTHDRRDYFELTTESKQDTSIDADGVFDVSDETRLKGEFRYEYVVGTRDRFADAGDDGGREKRQELAAAAALEQDFDRLRLTLTGTIFDQDYRSVIDAGTSMEDERSYSELGLRLRASYKVTDNLRAFLEGAYNERDYQRNIDDDGILRGSSGFGIFAGIERKLTGKVSASAAIGYRLQDPDDPSFSNIDVFVAEGSVQWRPTESTAVTVSTETTIDETTTDASAALLSRNVELKVQQIIRGDLAFIARASYGLDDYLQSDSGRKEEILRGSARLDYAFNPNMVFSLRYAHEQLFSNIPDDDVISNIIRLGVRFQI